MSLDWSVKNVKDFETRCWITLTEDWPSRLLKAGDEVVNPVTETLVWLTVSTGMPEITEDNAAEFLARTRIIEATYGAMLSVRLLSGSIVDKPISAEDVYNHIGLYTNASKMTKATFTKNIYDVLLKKSREALSDAAEK